MRTRDISEMPTVIEKIPSGAAGVHESVLRSYQILEQVKHYLHFHVAHEIILELIGDMEYTPIEKEE